MKNITDTRIQNGEDVSKETLIEKIKTNDPIRFDQMLIESEERKTYYYVKYKAIAYTRKPKTLKFPLFKDLQNDFEKTIERSGELKILEDDRIIKKVISKGYEPTKTIKYAGLNLAFSELKLITENDKVKQKQPFYYFPKETHRHTCGTCDGAKYTTCPEYECQGQHIYDCNECNATGKIDCDDCDRKGYLRCRNCSGRGEYSCGRCAGKGESSCTNCSGRGSESDGSRCTHCSGRGYQKCGGCRDGIIRCEKCSGKGELRCNNCAGRGEVTCKECKGKRQITCHRCYGDHIDGRYGKVDCETCETAGELASISYIETKIKSDTLDLFFTDKTEIDAPDFNLNNIKQFVNENGQLMQTYKNLNGDVKDNYDEYSSVCSENALAQVGDYKDRYPKLISEEMYYEGVPCVTFSYNHILTSTFHNVSVLSIDNTKEVLFHSNPANVIEEKESFTNKVNELFRQAFSTKTFKEKIDRKHEMILLVHMAKADGVITEIEKRYLSQNISGLQGFTQKEKAELFGLMSVSTLPPILPTNAYFSTKERAEEAKKKIVDLITRADEEYTPQEKAKLEEINRAIYLGYKAKPSALGRFLKTWQVSIFLFILPLLIGLGLVFNELGLIYYLPWNASSEYPEEPITEPEETEEIPVETEEIPVVTVPDTTTDPLNGPGAIYYENGQLKVTGSFKEGERDGVWEWYYQNGQLDAKEYYKEGKANGVCVEYFENGRLKVNYSFKEGKRDGVWKWYHQNGQLDAKGSYKEGKQDGLWEWYFEDGQLESKETWKDGVKIE